MKKGKGGEDSKSERKLKTENLRKEEMLQTRRKENHDRYMILQKKKA